MQKQGEFLRFYGNIVALMATAITAAVVWYFVYTFWFERTLDLGITFGGSEKIPPESYPILLLVLWSVTQRLKAHARPKDGWSARFWQWEDEYEAIGAILFFLATIVYAFALKSNLSFVLVLGAFMIQAVADAMLNGRHRFASEDAFSVGVGLEHIPDEAQKVVDVTIKPRYFIERPDGEKVAYDPRPLIEHAVPPATAH